MTSATRIWIFVLLAIASAGLPGELRAQDLKVGLVLEQDGGDEMDAKVVNAATDAFLRTRRFAVIERDALDSVFKEKGLKGFIGDSEGADIGETLGLDWIGVLSYSVDRSNDGKGGYRYSYNISVRMLEVASAQVVHTIDSKTGEWSMGADSVDAAGERLLDNLLVAFPPQGYVIQMLGDDRVVVDMGAEQGLREGDTLEVFTHGEPIIHPVTGREIPGRKITQALLKVVSVDAGLSTCKIKKAEGAVQVGSVVQFTHEDNPFGKIMKRLPFRG